MRLLLLCTAQLAFAASLVFPATPSRGHGTLRNRGGANLPPRAGSATVRSDTSPTIAPTGYRRGLLNKRDTPPTSSSVCTQTVSSTVFVTATVTSYTTVNATSTTTLTTAAANTATNSANAISTYSCSCPSSTAAVGGSGISSGAWSSGTAGTGSIAGTNSVTGTSSGPWEGALPTSSFPAVGRRSWVRRDGCVCSSVAVSAAPSTSSAAAIATSAATSAATATGSNRCCSAGTSTNSAWEGALPTSSFPAIGRRADKRDECACSGSASGSGSAVTGATGGATDTITSAVNSAVTSAVTSAGTATAGNPTSASAAASASASAACTPGWGMVNMVANLYTSIVANVATNTSDPCTWGYGTTSLNRTCNSPSWAFVYNIYAASDTWESTAPTDSAACVLSGVGTDELNAPVITVYHEEPFLTVYPNNSGISVTCS
ncbi:hypothetical protein JCM24511_09802 [Saitozyma sp. JCM 24511]|nr:hypothetical protein JCM24511_09802 [Saitozyma sp. JCM 24511]